MGEEMPHTFHDLEMTTMMLCSNHSSLRRASNPRHLRLGAKTLLTSSKSEMGRGKGVVMISSAITGGDWDKMALHRSVM